VGGDYIKLVAQTAAGVLGLKVATIYNNSTTPFVAFQPLMLKKGETEYQYGLIVNFETLEKEQFYNVNLHLSGGKTDKDKSTRNAQLENLQNKLGSAPYTNKTNLIISGDFNMDISEVTPFLVSNLTLQPHLDTDSTYPTENRVQYRNRDGQVGLDVVQRTIDGIFFQARDIDLLGTLKADDEVFEAVINHQALMDIKGRLKTEGDHERLLKEVKGYQKKRPGLGFPNEIWFSDHLPVGAILKIKKKQ
jgi:hypothetical protein